MKQEFIDFLGNSADIYCSRIEEASDSLFVYGSSDMFSMSALSCLIKFAQRHKLHYYVSTRHDEVYFRFYKKD